MSTGLGIFLRGPARATGWVLFAMGAVFASIGMLSLAGLMSVQIDFFGVDLQTKNDRVAWVIGWLVAAMVGLLMSGAGKRRQEPEEEP